MTCNRVLGLSFFGVYSCCHARCGQIAPASGQEEATQTIHRVLWLFAIPCCTASATMARPNASRVLVVHDTGLAWTNAGWPGLASPPPAGCNEADNEATLGSTGDWRLWKAYAAFPADSSLRSLTVSWGIDNASKSVNVRQAWLPDPYANSEVSQGAFRMPVPLPAPRSTGRGSEGPR